jgi:hypothetical protein
MEERGLNPPFEATSRCSHGVKTPQAGRIEAASGRGEIVSSRTPGSPNPPTVPFELGSQGLTK